MTYKGRIAMDYIKKFSTVRELLNSEEFKNKDLSYCDLSGLDLKSLSWKTWKGFKFFHTNFRATNISFVPSTLRVNEENYYCMEYCDFTGCDLSNIRDLNFTSYKGSKFLNTHLHVTLFIHDLDDIKDVVFSDEMADEVRDIAKNWGLDISTLELNPHIPFSSNEIFSILKGYIPKSGFIRADKYDYYCNLIDKFLEEDRKREGALYEFYKRIGGSSLSKIDKIQFFRGLIHDRSFVKLDLSSIPRELLNRFMFKNCKIDELILPQGEMPRLAIIDKKFDSITHTVVPHIIISGLDASSWQSGSSKRLGETCFTRQTNLYLELGRSCNAACPFCRNQYLKRNKLDIDAVLKSFRSIEPFLNNVVIGGGEPTLPKTRDLLKEIHSTRENFGASYFLSTNGTCGMDYLYTLTEMGYKINLSRHAVEDEDNDKIFGVKAPTMEEIRDRKGLAFYKNYLTLVATCFKGGLDSVEALERYIELADYLHVNSILFQSMHEDMDDKGKKLLQIDEMIFDEVIAHLREQNYRVSELPIYSTGDYKLIIVKSADGSKTYSFKRYISKEELEREWFRSSKRTFDLSIAPNGDIFQNWHQSSDKVLCIEPEKSNREYR